MLKSDSVRLGSGADQGEGRGLNLPLPPSFIPRPAARFARRLVRWTDIPCIPRSVRPCLPGRAGSGLAVSPVPRYRAEAMLVLKGHMNPGQAEEVVWWNV